MSRYSDDEWWYYTPAVPLPVRGGIRARSQRGAFGMTWWGRRWVLTLESFDIGARLSRGKSYARGGQVADLVIGAGEVTASVQGTRRKPYAVSIQLRSFTPEEWQGIVRRLRRMPIEVAALLQGEMPEALDAIVQGLGLSLFPTTSRDLRTNCSCPDWSNPCKHIAAVYYLLAEAFDDDPFLLLRLRGMDRDQLLAQLQTAAVRRAVAEPRPESAVPLPAAPSEFWGSGSPFIYNPIPDENPPPPVVALLGPPGLWRAERRFDEAMHSVFALGVETAEEFTAFWEGGEEA